MRIVTRTGICKTPSGTYYLDVGGISNFDASVNLKGNLLMDSTATIEAAVGAGGDVTVGSSTDTTIVNIGTGSHAKTITIGNSLDTVYIRGNTQYDNVTNLNIDDKLITINKNGATSSASGAGLEIEENAAITGYFKTSTDRNAFTFKAPNKSGILRIEGSTSAFTHTVLAINTADRIWTLPDTTDTFAGLTSTQTLTNKTISSGNISGATNISGTETNTATSTYSSAQTFNGTLTATGTTNLNGTTTFGGSVTFSQPTSGYGVIPIGGVIALFTGTGTFSPPSSGTVSQGWMRADGAAIPGGQTMSGSTPNISDNRFIMGSTTSGSSAGANSLSTTTNSSGSFSGTSGATRASFTSAFADVGLPNHSHTFSLSANIGHNHAAFTSGSAGAHTHPYQDHTWAQVGGSGIDAGNNYSEIDDTRTTASAGAHTHSIDVPAFTGSGSVSGSIGSGNVAGTDPGAFGVSQLNSATYQNTHTHSLSGSVTASGTTTFADSRPQYISAIYLIRVK